MLERLGRGAAHRHWVVIALWLVAAAAIVVAAGRWGGAADDNFTIPGTPSQTALDLLQTGAPEFAGATASVVVQAPAGQQVTSTANAAAINASITNLKALPHVAAVSDPLTPLLPAGTSPTTDIPGTDIPVDRIVPAQVSSDGTITTISVRYDVGVPQLPPDTVTQLQGAMKPATDAGLTVDYGGPVVDYLDPPPAGVSAYADLIGLGFAVLILLVALGSVTGMLVPIGVAVASQLVSGAVVEILQRWLAIGTAAPAVGRMIGLGVGIDYSLFIVSRYRQNLGAGMEPRQAVGRAVATSGSAVLFAAVCVCLALLGLALIGIPYVATLGVTATVFVAVTVVAALTLLPAILGLLGVHIDALRLPWHKAAESPEELDRGLSARWARLVSKRAWIFAVLSLVVMVVIALPLRSLELGITDDGSAPAGSTQREAYDLTAQGFGAGATGPLLIALDLRAAAATGPSGTATTAVPATTTAAPTTTSAAPPGAGAPATSASASPLAQLQALPPGQQQSVLALTKALLDTPGVVSVTPAAFTSELGVLIAVPTTASSDPATNDLIETLRSTVIPQALPAGAAVPASDVYVGGATAEVIDLADTIAARFPWYIAAVLGLAFLLLMAVFRSLVVPTQAVIVNLLSIGASFGFLVVVFQWGWAAGVFGVDQKIPVVSFVPVMMFAVLFGLSMDYEVFLMSRIREEYVKSGDARGSVVAGLGATARVITAAALIMISVFLSFSTNPTAIVKMIALGMAVAVFLDATIVRMILVPSTMALMGRANWWFPHWLDRVVPRLHIDAPEPAGDGVSGASG